MKAGNLDTNFINLATALHRDALALELHRQPGWISRVFPSIETWPRDMQLWAEWEAIYCNTENPENRERARQFYGAHEEAMVEGAELLWPEAEDLYALMCMRVEGGHTAFDREKQGSPTNPNDCEFPEGYFGDGLWFHGWPKEPQLRVIALDPSKGVDARRSDYSAFVMLGVGDDDVYYVEADLARRPSPQMVADAITWIREFRPDAFGCESNQFQELIQHSLQDELRREKIAGVVVWGIENRINKHLRIRRLAPLLSRRRLRFKCDSPSTKLLVDQLRDFPTGDHDDGPDALEMAVRLAQETTSGASEDGATTLY